MLNTKNTQRVYCKLILIFIIGIKYANLIIQFVFFSRDLYNKNPQDCLLEGSIDLFRAVSFKLCCAFRKFFEENSMAWKHNHWTIEVQRALTIPPSSKGDAKKRRMEQIPALNDLCEKALKWIQYLPEIRKLENQSEKFMDFYFECKWGHNEDKEEEKEDDEDEDENQEKEQRLNEMQKEKPLLLKETGRMIKIMIDIAEDLGNPYLIEIIQGCFHDVEKPPICKRLCGPTFYVEKGLSEVKLKLSTFARMLAHPAPEELGISSQNCKSILYNFLGHFIAEKRQELQRSTCE
jgi:hypothetical protein